MTSLDLAHRIENVEIHMARSGLTPWYVSKHLEPVDPACANLCAASQVAPGWHQAANVCFYPPDWTSVRMRIEARADNDVSACWSRWLALAEGEALDLCDVHGQQRAASVGRGQELLFVNANIEKNRTGVLLRHG